MCKGVKVKNGGSIRMIEREEKGGTNSTNEKNI